MLNVKHYVELKVERPMRFANGGVEVYYSNKNSNEYIGVTIETHVEINKINGCNITILQHGEYKDVDMMFDEIQDFKEDYQKALRELEYTLYKLGIK